jgi:tetratricopeptide (TPR) repeat protein
LEVRKLSCPSCGAALEIPRHLSRAHCLCCGSVILLPSTPRDAEEALQDKLDTLVRLLKTAKEAWNLSDMVSYADRVLEIDDTSAFAWSCKGLATSRMSTWTEDRFEEGKAYVDKALSILPDDPDVASAHSDWASWYLQYLSQLSQLQWNAASEVWHAQYGRDSLLFRETAQRTVAPYAQAALSAVDKALSVVALLPLGARRDEAEVAFLNMKVAFLKSAITHADFGDAASARARLNQLAAKHAIRKDLKNLPGLRGQLQALEAEIAKLQRDGGLFASRRFGQRLRAREELLGRIEEAERLGEQEAR